MEQQPESEKPFLLQQLLPHGILAAGLLLGGWLMPAQFNILHPKVLRQAGADTQTFTEFYDSHAPKGDVQAVLNISRLKIENADQDDSKLPELKIENALEEFIDPAKRFSAINAYKQKGGVCGNLIDLIPAMPEYGTALILTARLQDEGQIVPPIHQGILAHDPRLFNGKSLKELHSAELRQILHALLILGNRLNHEQLGELTAHIPDTATLKALAKIAKHQTMVPAFSLFDVDPASPDALTSAELFDSAIGRTELFDRYDTNSSGASKDTLTRDEWMTIGHVPLQYTDFPTTYAACVWSGDPSAVTRYLLRHGRRGDQHLRAALNQGKGSLVLVLERQLPVSSLNTPALDTVASFCYNNPRWALAVKYLLIGLGCLVLMRTWSSFFTVTVSDVDSQRAYRMRRRTVSLALFLTLVALSEPVLFAPVFSSEYQVPINLPLAAIDSTETPNPIETMEPSKYGLILSIIFIVIFAAIQAFVYYACVSKIKDVQNGAGNPRLKLQLLENEDNLFDTGLYVGIAGTALMLAVLIIFPSLNISVSAAYASNIFGILCVAVVKIFHVRGTRQMLILEAESGEGSAV